jgi:DNA-binding transcriptional LysR family regulator
MDLDLRKVRYFVQLAELKHFGRAAEMLHIAQPVLSRQIRALEGELGCDLLERTTRSVTLTPSGLQLQRTAPSLLAASNSTVRGVHEVARGTKHLAVGFAPGLSIAPAVQAFEIEHPEVEVDLVRLNWYEQGEALVDGRIDVGYLRRPFYDRGLRAIPIGEERSVVFLPSTHELANRDFLMLAELDGEKVLDGDRRHTSTIEEKLELVAAGHGVAILPESVGRYYSSESLSRLPIVDAPVQQLCLAVLSARRQPHLRAFMQTAHAALAGHRTRRRED